MGGIWYKQLCNFVKDTTLYRMCNLHGFQPGDSTVNQLIEMFDHIRARIDKGRNNIHILWDL